MSDHFDPKYEHISVVELCKELASRGWTCVRASKGELPSEWGREGITLLVPAYRESLPSDEYATTVKNLVDAIGLAHAESPDLLAIRLLALSATKSQYAETLDDPSHLQLVRTYLRQLELREIQVDEFMGRVMMLLVGRPWTDMSEDLKNAAVHTAREMLKWDSLVR